MSPVDIVHMYRIVQNHTIMCIMNDIWFKLFRIHKKCKLWSQNLKIIVCKTLSKCAHITQKYSLYSVANQYFVDTKKNKFGYFSFCASKDWFFLYLLMHKKIKFVFKLNSQFYSKLKCTNLFLVHQKNDCLNRLMHKIF